MTVADQVYLEISCGQDVAAAPVFVTGASSSAAEAVAATTGDDAEHEIPSS